MRNYLFLLVISSFVGGMAVFKEVGTVSGHVYVGAGNQPAVAASVYLESLDGPNPGRPSVTKTNGEGGFSIEVQPGKYAVHAFKPDDGYPDVVFAFNLEPDQKLKEVKISAGQHLNGLDIRLGPKPAVLSFDVTDAETGALLSSVDYELCQVQHPDWCLRGGAPGKTEFSSPATDIAIQLGSAGYKTTRYVENGKTFVSLAPGEHREIPVALRRSR
jgi:hypothetical protein